MRTFVIILIALVASYLTGVGLYNDWNLFAGLEPVECVSLICLLSYLFVCYAFAAWVVLTGVFDL